MIKIRHAIGFVCVAPFLFLIVSVPCLLVWAAIVSKDPEAIGTVIALCLLALLAIGAYLLRDLGQT